MAEPTDRERKAQAEKEAKAEKKEKSDLAQKLSVYTGIPAMMVGGLLVGWFIGRYLDNRFHGNNIILGISMLVGFAAGAYQVIEMLKKFQ
jgi:F0F1-type ATP synthase assembly protein I